MLNEKGQLSLEFLLIFSLFLIFLITFTLPLTEESIKNNIEIEDAITTKYEILKLVDAINNLYNQGEGSKKTIFINLNKDTFVDIKDGTLKYNNKEFTLNNNISESLYLKKGLNKITVSFPVNSETIELY
ncbi:MAG: hypothetical protein KO202_01750 [Methanobacteriaceae archaeon]|jgi:uncharacterized protein (UPF0333 family)|nr:hypothetical protein [Methanobacteriaceae archaeon]